MTGAFSAAQNGQAPNFPTAGFQTAYGGGSQDAFVLKLNVTGASIVYSTFPGGGVAAGSDPFITGSESGNAIAVDRLGQAYVTGATSSANFPQANGLPSSGSGGTRDAFERIKRAEMVGAFIESAEYRKRFGQ